MKKNIMIIAFSVLLGLAAILIIYFNWSNNSVNTNKESLKLESKNNFCLKLESGDCTGNIANDTKNIPEVASFNIATIHEKIEFDGKTYFYKTDEITVEPEDEYLYFYRVSGQAPKSEVEQVMYILANEKYSYEEISKSIFSSNSEEHLEFILICMANN